MHQYITSASSLSRDITTLYIQIHYKKNAELRFWTSKSQSKYLFLKNCVVWANRCSWGRSSRNKRAIAPSHIKLGISLCIKWMFQQKLEIAQKQDMPNFLICAKQSVLERLVFLRFSVWKWFWPINRPYIILSTPFWFKICLIMLKGGVKICSLVLKRVTIYNCVLR